MEHKQKQNLPKSARSSQYNQYILLYPIIFVHLSKLKLLNRNNLFLCHLSLEGKGKKEIIAMFLEKKKSKLPLFWRSAQLSSRNFGKSLLEVGKWNLCKTEKWTNMEWTNCKTKLWHVQQNIKFNQQEYFLSRDYDCHVAVLFFSRICNVNAWWGRGKTILCNQRGDIYGTFKQVRIIFYPIKSITDTLVNWRKKLQALQTPEYRSL